MIQILLGFLFACVPKVTPDTPKEVPGDTATESGEHILAVISTLANDYSVGAIATVELDTLALHDTLAPTSGDTVVAALDSQVAVLNRLNTDTLRVYNPGEWEAPVFEVALPDLGNPQDAKHCGGLTWVTLHNAAQISAFDVQGRQVTTADLVPFAGTDGAAEAASLSLVEGELYVAIQQLAQDDGWQGDGGVIGRIDCATGDVEAVLDASPSPLLIGESDTHALGIKTGLYGSLDGAIALYNPATGETDTVVTELEIGLDITAAAIHESSLVFLSADEEWNYSIHCMDLASGDWSTASTHANFLSDVSIDNWGRAWISARQGWSPDTASQPGIQIIDAASCSPVSEEWIHTTLPPYNVAFL